LLQKKIMSQTTEPAENISGGKSRVDYDDAVYKAAKNLVDSFESEVTVDSSLKHRKAGMQVLADATKVDKCPAPLVGCSAAELFKATGGELSCPDLSMAPEPLIIDGKGRICYAKEDITNHWMETGPDGKKRYKKITVENLINKYSQELLEKFLDPSNKKLLIAASQAARNGFHIPPIILNFYKYNPFVFSFIKNSSKMESRTGRTPGDSKKFRGLKQFTIDNGYAEYQTQEIFATILSNFTNSLDLNTGAEFLTTMMTPLIRTPETIRGIFDIYCPSGSVNLDFLDIEPYQRSDPSPIGVIHAVNANICELIFSAIAAMSRDTRRVEKLTKLINSLGEMLKFGELAPEYENPENKCRQAGVAAFNSISFLPNTLKKWLGNLPSTWRKPGPLPNQPMNQREDGHKPACRGGGGSGGGGSALFPLLSSQPQQIPVLPRPSQQFFPQMAPPAQESRQPMFSPAQPKGEGVLEKLAILAQMGKTSEQSVLPLYAGEALELEGGARVDYYPPSEIDRVGYGGRESVANPATVQINANEENVLDPRLILQNFVSLCFYLNWVESFTSSSDDSILSMFKSLRVSHEAAMSARANVEELLRLKAEEAKLRNSSGTNFKSAVTDKMAEEALAAKKGADASYMGTNVRIAKRLAKLLDIGWDKCKSDRDLQSFSSDLAQNGWHDKMLPHQNLVLIDPTLVLQTANLRFTVNQMPGLGHNELRPDLSDSIPNHDYPDYPDGQNDEWRSSTIYQNMQDSLLMTGVNTREFRKAWKNTSIAFDGIKSKKNSVARVGYMQFMSRIMDLHLTFAQSSSAGRDYFLKMHEYSLMKSKRAGIPEDPRISALNFDDPGHEMSNYLQVAQATKNLLQPLPSINVCKVVVGESQYFVFKTAGTLSAHEKRTNDENAKERLHVMYKSYRNSSSNPQWWKDILTLGNTVAALPGAGLRQQLSEQDLVGLSSFIIEHSVNFVATSLGPTGRVVQQDKMFGACEPLDTSDYYMLNRRKKVLEMDRPEDELFLLGIEGIAKYLDQAVLWNDVRDPDPEFARRRNIGPAAARGMGAQSERLKVRDTHQDTLRRKGSSEGLNADERDWYARYIIFMTKVSGGSPARLAQYLLEIMNGDSNIYFQGGAPNPQEYSDPYRFAAGARPAPRTLREGIAMSLVYLVRNPAPLFASMGPLHGGDENVTQLSGGSTDGTTPELPAVEVVDSMINSEIDTLLSGGIEGGRINENSPQFKPPLHIQQAMEAAKKGLTYEEEDLERRLRKTGRKIVRYDVGDKCPVSLAKYNNLFGKSGNAAWVETNSPWIECQRKMGFQFQTNSGYCYPADDKCYPASDIKHSIRKTANDVTNWQALARVVNSLNQAEREEALQNARRIILSEPANENIGHSELEDMAHKMLPESLRMLPDKVAMESIIAVSEDIEGQVKELGDDNSDEEQKARLRKLLFEHKLLYEQWQDPNKELQAEYLNELTKELVENAKICATVSLAISAQSSSAQLKQNMRGAINYANTMMTPNPSLPTEFVQSLPEDTQVLIRSSALGSKCEVRPLYERDGVILPTKINSMLPEEGDGSEIKHDGLINWWKQYHASTLERKTKKSDKLSQSIDPSLVNDSKISSSSSEVTLQKQLEKALDSKGLALLENAETKSGSRSRRRSRSRSSRSRG